MATTVRPRSLKATSRMLKKRSGLTTATSTPSDEMRMVASEAAATMTSEEADPTLPGVVVAVAVTMVAMVVTVAAAAEAEAETAVVVRPVSGKRRATGAARGVTAAVAEVVAAAAKASTTRPTSVVTKRRSEKLLPATSNSTTMTSAARRKSVKRSPRKRSLILTARVSGRRLRSEWDLMSLYAS